jgi:hypothetical protein
MWADLPTGASDDDEAFKIYDIFILTKFITSPNEAIGVENCSKLF